MNLTDQQKRICEQVVNVFETGSVEGNYGAIAIFPDGPHGARQVTYGRSQTTEYGNLEELVQLYVDKHGQFSRCNKIKLSFSERFDKLSAWTMPRSRNVLKNSSRISTNGYGA
jgi:hypothetical protein